MTPPATNSDAVTPLLPEQHPRKNKRSATVSGAVFNVSTSIIGAGIMSIPATLKVLGVVPAVLLIVIVAVLTDISVEFLLRFTHSGWSTTYAGVMGDSFGRIGSFLVQICVMITNLGCLIIYLIIIGDVLSGNQHGESLHLGVLQEWFGSHWWNARAYVLLFVLIFILLPLVLFRRIESLKVTSAISILLAVVFMGICSVMAIYAILQGKSQNPRLLPVLNNQASFFNLFTTVPVIVTAFTFHFNVHPIGMELGNPSEMTLAVRISLLICAAIYVAVGFFGYLLFGDSIMPDILVNFDRSSDSSIGLLLNDAVRLSYALHLVLAFPLVNFSLRGNVDELLFPRKPLLAKDSFRFVFLSCILLVFTYLLAVAIPNIWYVFQFMGSTSAVSLAFIFPAALILRDVHGISTRRDRAIAFFMVTLAVLTSTIAIASNVWSLGGRKS